MSTKQQAASEIKRLSKLFRGLIDLGEQLEQVGSLEQAAENAERTLADSKRKIAELVEILSSQHTTISFNDTKIATMIENAENTCKEKIRQAEIHIEVLTSNAEKVAETIVSQAKWDAEKIAKETKEALADTIARAALAKAELKELENSILDAKQRRDEVRSALSALRERL